MFHQYGQDFDWNCLDDADVCVPYFPKNKKVQVRWH